MTKQKVGKYLVWAGYGLLAIGAAIAFHHPLIIALLIAGGGSLFVGRQFEKSL